MELGGEVMRARCWSLLICDVVVGVGVGDMEVVSRGWIGGR